MAKTETYKQLKDELTAILEWFETADADVEEAAVQYQRAVKLMKDMEAVLKAAELTVEKVK